MDPYKILGLPARKVTGEEGLNNARHRAKKLFKRYCAEKKKFDAKKVMEAFEMIKANLKNKPGEGAYKILGRSRKERELDKHFNHQTKEITKNKDLKRVLQMARNGEKRLHLPGDKERIPKHRRKKRKHTKKRREQIDALQGLQRLAEALRRQEKFPKGIKLLYRWMQGYMNADNRDSVIAVLQDITQAEFILDEAECHQDLIQIFEYVTGYFSDWFKTGPEHGMLRNCWQVAAVLACRCFTDDGFVLSATIAKLNEMLSLMEEHKDELLQRDQKELEAAPPAPPSPGAIIAARLQAKQEAAAKQECKEEELPSAAKFEQGPKTEAKNEAEAKAEVKQNGTEAAAKGMALPVASCRDADMAKEEENADEALNDNLVESLGSSDEVESLGSSEGVKEEPIELGSDDDDVDPKEEEISSGDDSVFMEEASDDEVEMEECPAFIVPHAMESLSQMRGHFVNRCLGALFQQRGPMWARPKIDAFFLDVFHRRAVFGEDQRVQVEAWQSRIKDSQKITEREVGTANNPLEAHRPVRDSREERVTMDSDSNVWSAKQTFDSRDRCGARQVIR